MRNKKTGKWGCVLFLIIAGVFCYGNYCLFVMPLLKIGSESSMDGKWWETVFGILGILLDVALIVLLLYRMSHNHRVTILNKKKQLYSDKINHEIKTKETIQKVFNDWENENKRINSFLSLLINVGNENDSSLMKINESFTHKSENDLPELIKKLPDEERIKCPNNKNDIQIHQKEIKCELHDLRRKVDAIKAAVSKSEFEKIIGKEYKRGIRITIITIFCLLSALCIIGLALFLSPNVTFYLAKKDFEQNFDIESLAENDELGEIEVSKISYYGFNANNMHKIYWYSFVAENDNISKYYTQTENSYEASHIVYIMKNMHERLSSQQYKYHNANGWDVDFEFDQFSIYDKNGHSYEYKSYSDGFYCLEIDNKFVIFNSGNKK